jgi:hypothetical protein
VEKYQCHDDTQHGDQHREQIDNIISPYLLFGEEDGRIYIDYRAHHGDDTDIQRTAPGEYLVVPEQNIGNTANQNRPDICGDDEILYPEPRYQIDQSLTTHETAKEDQEGDRGNKDGRIPLDLRPHETRQKQRYQEVGDGR